MSKYKIVATEFNFKNKITNYLMKTPNESAIAKLEEAETINSIGVVLIRAKCQNILESVLADAINKNRLGDVLKIAKKHILGDVLLVAINKNLLEEVLAELSSQNLLGEALLYANNSLILGEVLVALKSQGLLGEALVAADQKLLLSNVLNAIICWNPYNETKITAKDIIDACHNNQNLEKAIKEIIE